MSNSLINAEADLRLYELVSRLDGFSSAPGRTAFLESAGLAQIADSLNLHAPPADFFRELIVTLQRPTARPGTNHSDLIVFLNTVRKRVEGSDSDVAFLDGLLGKLQPPAVSASRLAAPPLPVLNVFISSKMIELKEERQALHDLIPNLGQGKAILRPWLYEDHAEASSHSTRETFLTHLKRSDLYIGLFWNLYGEWTIDEFEKAAEWEIETHLYVKDQESSKRDKKLKAFLTKHADVVGGLSAPWFTSLDDLRKKVTQSIDSWLQPYLDTLPARRIAQGAILAKKGDLGGLQNELPPELIGREDLMAKVQTLLDQNNHVLLQGFAGMGKSVLAASLASARIAQDKGPVLWLHVGDEQARALLEKLARAFNRQNEVTAADNKATMVRTILAESGVKLLVLDSVWDEKALEDIMQVVPDGMVALITSRSRIVRTKGRNRLVDVGELAPDKALALLSYYAQREYGNDQRAAALCKRLGNHPYALEIAGCTIKMKNLTPGELLEQTEKVLVNMGFPGMTVPPGRKSVAALIEVSLKSLGKLHKELFMAFGAMFTPSATVALLARYPRRRSLKSIEDALNELQTFGLLTRIEPTDSCAAYYRVPNLARSYARAAKPVGKRSELAVIKACRDYAKSHASDTKESLNALQAERENLLLGAQTAHRLDADDLLLDIMRALSVDSTYLAARGYTSEALDMLKPGSSLDMLNFAIQAAKDRGQLEAAHYLLGKLGDIYLKVQNNYELAFQSYTEALELARALKNSSRQARLLSLLGMVRFQQRHPADAESYFEQAYQLASAHHDDLTLSVILSHRGQVAMSKEDYGSGWRFADEAVKVAARLKADEVYFGSLLNRGGCEMELKRYPEALTTHRTAYEFARDKENLSWMATILFSLGEDYHAIDDKKQAQENLGQALNLAKQIGATALEKAIRGFMTEDKRQYAT